jgi:hypothetical protein
MIGLFAKIDDGKKEVIYRVLIIVAFAFVSKFIFPANENNSRMRMLLPVMLWSKDHSRITRAAIDALSEKEQEFLEPEKDLLVNTYCMFPDNNSAHCGDWGDDPNGPRTPDIRREWDISYYVGWDPLRDEGLLFPPSDIAPAHACPPPPMRPVIDLSVADFYPMGSYITPKIYVPRILEALRCGRHADAVRFLGVLLHHVQDIGAFMYWPDIHCVSHLHDEHIDQIGAKGHQAQILGTTEEDAIENIIVRMRDLIAFTEDNTVPKIKKAMKTEDEPMRQRALLNLINQNVNVCADVIRTILYFTDGYKYPVYFEDYIFSKTSNPININLIKNPSFEIGDGTGVPAGWVVGWHDLEDKIGRAEWEWSRKNSVFSRASRSGQRSAKLMWTPGDGIEWRQRWTSAFTVKSGEEYKASAWVKFQEATGENYLILYFYKRDNTAVGQSKSSVVKGSGTWQNISFTVRVPEGAEKARVACRSDANKGVVWFDDIEVMQIG